MSEYHYIITLMTSQQKYLTASGIVDWQHGQTRAEIYKIILDAIAERGGEDPGTVIVIFFSLERNT